MKIPTFLEVMVPLFDGFWFYAGDSITWFFFSVAYPLGTWGVAAGVVAVGVLLVRHNVFVSSANARRIVRRIEEIRAENRRLKELARCRKESADAWGKFSRSDADTGEALGRREPSEIGK